MASKGFTSCCGKSNIHEGEPKGSFSKLFNVVDTYISGESNGTTKIIVILTDIFGHKFSNNNLIADEFAAAGYQVLIPDILFNDPYPAEAGIEISSWFQNHTIDKTREVVEAFLSALKKEYNPEFIGLVGHCFGAKFVIQQLAHDGLADAGAIAHPSLVAVEEVESIRKPIIISVAETDRSFTDELRHKTESILKGSNSLRYQITLFSGVTHGYAVRCDPSDPVQRYAKEKTLFDQVSFFSSVSNNYRLP